MANDFGKNHAHINFQMTFVFHTEGFVDFLQALNQFRFDPLEIKFQSFKHMLVFNIVFHIRKRELII